MQTKKIEVGKIFFVICGATIILALIFSCQNLHQNFLIPFLNGALNFLGSP
jgi:hypothetical protein